jgi:hypothetical protein
MIQIKEATFQSTPRSRIQKSCGAIDDLATASTAIPNTSISALQ